MRIALDIDDVLADFVGGVHEVLGNPKELEAHDHWHAQSSTGRLMITIDSANRFVGFTGEYLTKCEHNPEFWASLDPISLPCDIDFDVACYITSSPKNMVEVRREWLRKNGFPIAPVIHSTDKLDTMRKLKIDVLVDDKLATVQAVNQGGLDGIHFKPWYSSVRSKFTITSLTQLKKYVVCT